VLRLSTLPQGRPRCGEFRRGMSGPACGLGPGSSSSCSRWGVGVERRFRKATDRVHLTSRPRDSVGHVEVGARTARRPAWPPALRRLYSIRFRAGREAEVARRVKSPPSGRRPLTSTPRARGVRMAVRRRLLGGRGPRDDDVPQVSGGRSTSCSSAAKRSLGFGCSRRDERFTLCVMVR